MSASEQAGQLLMVGLDVNARRSSLDDLVRDRHLGGVVLLGGWFGGAEPVRSTTKHLNSLVDGSGAPRLLLAADQEGGNVQQLRGEGFTRIPTGRAQAALGTDVLTRRAASWATELRAVGINVNLAPVADTVPADVGRDNDPIGQWDRQYASDPDAVSRAVGAFIDGMHRGGVAATIKHFPGIGRITGNTDLTADGITDRTTTATDPYLRPFESGIADGADLVMVGSAIYSRIEPGVHATFSKRIVTDLLRTRLGYDGVVITDDVGAAKAVSGTPVGARATRFVDAGGDIVLTARPDTAPTMHRALTRRMADSGAFAAKVRQSATRVLQLKVERGLASCT
ncbi:glycoside hydrolase family 3 N-terminal domain-containing protein [Intrasporangium sp.]|uniref:glycoside hydrolase family 3 N-terminal domain-containing protein n=1 Tax=Intrasporangium sp. TaxID=1925024 RepID=UPI00293AB681|nr:glycoside hydrolase family 3 N-terminal domain-containing protein [Intrasporangium sp.]MDV3223285.1 glycoside hydrolase family 3 protein [Intrasporangium sp.]